MGKMMKIQISVSRILSAALSCLLLSYVAMPAIAQQTNLQKLPLCPNEKWDSVRNWHKCFGSYSRGNNYFYEGEFQHGKPHGFGKGIGHQDRYSWKRGTYEGQWVNGDPDGLGVFDVDDGSRLEGRWSYGKFIQNEKVNLAEFKNNLLSSTGYAEIEREQHDQKQTNTGNLLPCPSLGNRWDNCVGYYTYSQGVYVGEYKDNLRHGQGIFTTKDGKRFEGVFENDKFVREAKVNLPNKNFNGTEKTDRSEIKRERQQRAEEINPNKLPPCPREYYGGLKWHNCWGTLNHSLETYTGEFRNHKYDGLGTHIAHGTRYVGEFKNGYFHGLGTLTFRDGSKKEGLWEAERFVREVKIASSDINNNVSANNDRADIERERQQLAEERRSLEQEKREREQQRNIQRINLQVTYTQPASDGSVTINVQTGADTASLLINGEEQGGRTSGDYIIKKVARAGQETKFTVIATDINGNKDTKSITVTRQVVESAVKYAQLNPAQVKKQPERDAVAVIIGIAKYESLPVVEFANDDARAFYDYAIRGLGVKPENIKLLVDEGAREAEILKTFRTWLPSRVKSSTEVFVFYSGHGLPTPDGSGLYLLPLHADREVIDDTAIPFTKINDAISMAKPKSVTVILDACYSGQTKAGQTLVASARPLALKAQNSFFPPNFTVISASQSDQISSSSPDLQHGIFSYYLMKGMEGDADMNKDGKITLGEMRDYLVEQVGRQAAMMSRKQEPQLIGDAGRVLVGR
jgi:hypothetical protein